MDSEGVFTGYKLKHWPMDIGDGLVASDLPAGMKDEGFVWAGGIVRMYPDGDFQILEKGKKSNVVTYGNYTGGGYYRGGYAKPKSSGKVVGTIETKKEKKKDDLYQVKQFSNGEWWETTDGGKTWTFIEEWSPETRADIERRVADKDSPPESYDPETDWEQYGVYGDEIDDQMLAYYKALGGGWGHME
jgi:hypothetical protein